MRLHVGGIGIAVLAVAAIGCSEPSQTLPAGPRVQAAVTATSAPKCDFKTLSQLATHYFGSAEAKVVRGIISRMQDSGAFSLTAKNGGFDVMTHIAANVKAGNTGVADASNMTNGLLACMFNNPADLPPTFPEDFTIATNPALHGAYDVRGGGGDSTGPVLSRPLDAPFSGVAPSGSNTWPGVLSGNPAPARVLIYGQPGLVPNTFDWRAAPYSVNFSPAVIVGVCLDANANATSLIHEEHVGLLPFADAAFLPTCTGLASQSWGSQFASRLVRWGMSVLGPRPLSATTFLNPGGLAGSTGSLRSEFGPQVVDTVTLTFTVQPSDVKVNSFITPAVVVRATAVTDFGIDSVPNVSITLAAFNNNGTPALLSGTLTQTTGADGKATFADLSETKTGGYVLVATGTVNGRTAILVPAATSARFNVKP